MVERRLNPCSNGIQKYYEEEFICSLRGVLILVLMEYKNTRSSIGFMFRFRRLNPCSYGIQKYAAAATIWALCAGLNPCSNGIQKYVKVGYQGAFGLRS